MRRRHFHRRRPRRGRCADVRIAGRPLGEAGYVVTDGYVGASVGSGRNTRLLLVEVETRRVYTVATGAHTVFTDICSGLVVWQSPEEGRLERDGSDYWVAELP